MVITCEETKTYCAYTYLSFFIFYYRILHQGEESQRRHEEDGRVVMVTENRANETDPNRRGHLVIKGTQQR